MKRILLTLAVVFSAFSAFAQQDIQLSNYMFYPNSVNPAYSGSREAISTVLLNRNQWVGFDGAPVTQVFNIHSPLLNYKLGVGLTLLNDKVGPIRKTGVFADYAYRLSFDNSNLALGIRAGADVIKANLANLTLIDVADESFQSDVRTKMMPNFGFGIHYYSEKYYLGLSTPKLIQNNVDVKTGDVTVANVGFQKMHFFLTSGYVMDVNNYIKFRPTGQLKVTYGAPISLDLDASFLFYEKLWLGAIFRAGDAMGAMVQFQFTNQLRAGYAYEFATTQMRHHNSGTHELMLGYDFTFSKSKILSPRYF